MAIDAAIFMGDIFHLASFLLTIISIERNKSSAGWSGRMQILTALVFITRYWNVSDSFPSIYKGCTKMLWILLAVYTLYIIYMKYSDTYEKRCDTFWIESIILAAGAASFIFVEDVYAPDEVCWLFSRFVESLSILPQFYFIFHKRKKNLIVTYYVVILINYRFFYILHWFHEYVAENQFNDFIIYPGVIQLVLYIFYFFIPEGKNIPQEEQVPPQLRNRPTFLTQESLLETPLLKRSATFASSIYVIGADDSQYSTLTRSTGSVESFIARDEGRY